MKNLIYNLRYAKVTQDGTISPNTERLDRIAEAKTIMTKIALTGQKLDDTHQALLANTITYFTNPDKKDQISNLYLAELAVIKNYTKEIYQGMKEAHAFLGIDYVDTDITYHEVSNLQFAKDHARDISIYKEVIDTFHKAVHMLVDSILDFMEAAVAPNSSLESLRPKLHLAYGDTYICYNAAHLLEQIIVNR